MEAPSDIGAQTPWRSRQCQLIVDDTLLNMGASDIWVDNLLVVLSPASTPVNGIIDVANSFIFATPDSNVWMTNVTLWGDAQATRGILMKGSSLYAEGALASLSVRRVVMIGVFFLLADLIRCSVVGDVDSFATTYVIRQALHTHAHCSVNVMMEEHL